MLNRRPFLLIISAPSGAGKTTLCRALIKRDQRLKYSVSVTTRPRRTKEEHGKDYFFLTEVEFDELARSNGLLEWEEVYGYRYGTPLKYVDEMGDKGFDVVFDLDIKGALNLKSRVKESVTVFLLPPSLAELRKRLASRAREKDDIIESRFAKARSEIERALEFDYVVVNDSLAESTSLLKAILEAERARAKRIEEIKIMED